MYCYVTNEEADLIFRKLPSTEENFSKEVEVIKRESDYEPSQSLGKKQVEFYPVKFPYPNITALVCSFDGKMFAINYGDVMVDISETQRNFFDEEKKCDDSIYNPDYQQFAVRDDLRPIDAHKKIVYIFEIHLS